MDTSTLVNLVSLQFPSLSPMPRQKRPLGPLIIGSFPAPPTHIPQTPVTPSTANPPLSRPPSVPLPPIPPASSRVSSYDPRNRRSSKLSLDPPSRPPSVLAPSSPIPGEQSLTHVALAPIDSDDDFLHLALSGATLPTPPSSNPSPTNKLRSHRHVANESISSIDMRDLMFDDDHMYADDMGDLPIPNLNVQPAILADPIDPQTLHLQMRTARSKSKQHRQMLRSRSASRPGSPVSLPPSEPLPPIPTSKITVPNNEIRKGMPPPSTLPHKPRTPPLPVRSVSPDIDTIISTTTRPQRSKSQSRARTSVASTSSLTPLSRSTSSMASETKRRASEGVVHSSSTSRRARGRRPVLSSYSEGAVERSELPYVRAHPHPDDDSRSWIEPDEFGIDHRSSPSSMVTADRGTDDEEREREERLERALEGVGSDSDSSLDIHTPLPHLMLRHGLLSPHSKLLPQAATPDINGRPESVASVASTTAMGLSKDTRDTPMRRTRHRDGRLLKGGVGLTTGLGWSDSEDEDAPSALTRRISALNLSRQPSVSSIHSSRSQSRSVSTPRAHPLSRSYSGGSLPDPIQYGDGFDGFDEFGRLQDGRHRSEWSSSSLPNFKQRGSKGQASTSSKASLSSIAPTAWQKRSQPVGSGGRTSTSSAGSGFSLEASIPEHEFEHEGGESYEERTTVAARTPRSMHPPFLSRNIINTSVSNTKSDNNTPSTTSTLSTTLPITPLNDYPSDSVPGRKLDKDKSLPPLPPSLKRTPTTFSNLRARTTSTGAATSPALQHTAPASNLGQAPSSGMATPRPLKLAQSNLIQPQKQHQASSHQGDRPAVPVPSVSFGAMPNKRSMQLPSPLLLAPRSPSTSGLNSPVTPSFSSPASSFVPGTPPGILKPKPRTGTGMVYRNSTVSRMRVPSTVMRTTTPTAVAIGQRPIAL